jgi:hypothetical protein
MAKRMRLRKRLLGVKVPRKLRNQPLRKLVHSPAGIAFVILVVAAAGRTLRNDGHGHGSPGAKIGGAVGLLTRGLAIATAQAIEAFTDALQDTLKEMQLHGVQTPHGSHGAGSRTRRPA